MIYAELIKRLRETSVDFGESDHISVMMIEAADAIEELSKDRKIGKWELEKIRGDLRTVCSCCGEESGTLYEFSYCPNCGARMVNHEP